MILTGDVSGGHGSHIFVSDDFGKSFSHQDLPFVPLMQIMYNPENSNVLLVLSNNVSGWILQRYVLFGCRSAGLYELESSSCVCDLVNLMTLCLHSVYSLTWLW